MAHTSRYPQRVLSGVLLVVTVLIAGCQPTVFLMPTPVALRSGELDPFRANPNLKGENRIKVLYATNRIGKGDNPDRRYTRDHDTSLRFGEAVLVVGSEIKPWEKLYAGSTIARREGAWAIQLQQVREQAVLPADAPLEPLSPELRPFFDDLNGRIQASLHKDLTVYVHGANNNFYRATAQAGQYRHFTGYNSVVLAFAWPSAESLFRYGTDVQNAAETAPVFARLLDLLARHSEARYINVLAYSAGAMVASPGLAILRSRYPDLSERELHARLRLGEVYFAAPDADLKSFVSDLASYKDMTCNVTVTVNLNDAVLGLAQFHQGASRAGRPNIDELAPEETQWLIDASRTGAFDAIDVNSSTIPDLSTGSHSFWYNNPWVSSDVLVQFLYHAGPAARGLAEATSAANDSVWYFPPDYPARVVEAVKTLDAAGERPDCRHRGTPLQYDRR